MKPVPFLRKTFLWINLEKGRILYILYYFLFLHWKTSIFNGDILSELGASQSYSSADWSAKSGRANLIGLKKIMTSFKKKIKNPSRIIFTTSQPKFFTKKIKDSLMLLLLIITWGLQQYIFSFFFQFHGRTLRNPRIRS